MAWYVGNVRDSCKVFGMVVVDIRYQTERSAPPWGHKPNVRMLINEMGVVAYPRISTKVRGLGTKIESPSWSFYDPS